MKQSKMLGLGTIALAAVLMTACGGESPSGQTECDPACGENQECKEGKCVDTGSTPSAECDPACGENQECKEGKCVDKGNNPPTGECDPACGENQECVDGVCKITSCPNNEKLCGESCIDVKSDSNNCGDCGAACTNGQVCKDGSCAFECESGQTACDDGCKDTKSDKENCGTCGNKCNDDQACTDGSCTISCESPLIACNNSCVDINLDASNCGSCGNKCNDGQSCNNGNCAVSCDAGKDLCGSDCVDLDSDASNCGSCGKKCNVEAGESCANGNCKVVCQSTQELCGNKCVDLKSDKNNCGECGHACDEGEKCNGGICGQDCGDLVDCNGNCIDPNTSIEFCGASNSCQGEEAGQKCGEGQVCQNGTCACAIDGESVCAVGESTICTDPKTSATYCGCTDRVAGVNCAALPGTASSECKDGVCDFNCDDTHADCDNDASTGCEADLNSVDSCGACGNKCEDPNAAETNCIAGACKFVCNTGYSECNNSCLNLNSDDENCGFCGNQCEGDAKCDGKGFCSIPRTKCVDGYITTTINGQQVRAYCLSGGEKEFESVRNAINAGNKYPDSSNSDNAYILLKDLDFGTKEWTPIGNSSHPFSGTFIGNGKSIQGKLTTNGSNVGLFGYVSNAILDGFNLKIDLTAKGSSIQHIGALAGRVHNSQVTRSVFEGSISDPEESSSTYDRMGGLIGYLSSSQISNCSSKANITFYGEGENGGLIGMLQGSTVEKCSSNSNIKIGSNIYFDAIGGLVGWAYYSSCSEIKDSTASGTIDLTKSTNTSSRGVAGIVGWQESCQAITDCSSSVNINAPAAYRVGGIFGNIRTDYTSGTYTTVSNSYATGTVSCRAACGGIGGLGANLKLVNSHATGKVTGKSDSTGGLIGWTTNASIVNSYATGDVEAGTNYIGGLVGDLQSSTIENSYATGSVKGTASSTNNIGGALGRSYASTVNNMYAKGEVSGGSTLGGLIGYCVNSTLNNGEAFGNVTCTKFISTVGHHAGALIGSLTDNSTVTNCVAVGNTVGSSYIGGAFGYIARGKHTIKNVYGTGTVSGDSYTAGFVGSFDNSNVWNTYNHGATLAIKNSYYWKDSHKDSVGGDIPNEMSVYSFIYNDDKEAVLDDDTSIKLAEMFSSEDWTTATCKLSSGPGTKSAGEYKIPVLKAFGTDVCK